MSDAEVMLRKLGLPSARLVLNGVETACQFFRTVLREDPHVWWEYFRGIDFHQIVRVETLPVGTKLSQHASTGRAREKPFMYFTVPGTSQHTTGTSFSSVQFRLFQTSRPTVALASVASPISFNNVQKGTFDPVSRMGGGKQYIIAKGDLPALVRVGGA